MLDAIIDNYFLVLEQINHRIEVLEDEVYANPKPVVAQNIQQLKKEVLKVRRWIYPVRELINRLIESEHHLWENGYYYVWGLMIVLFLGMLIYFKKKDWL